MEQSTSGALSGSAAARPKPRTRDLVFAGAVLLGLLADHLVRVPGRPGLGFALWSLGGGATLWLFGRSRSTPKPWQCCLFSAAAHC
jgi:hypothetical protein